MSNQQKVTNDIKVLNKDIEILKKHFSHCFDKDGNFQIEKFTKNLNEKEINFSSESYGMDWLGKSYARLLASDAATTLLKTDENHNQKTENANAENLLIKGDNLEVLKHLSNAYHEKIKMIYIDPPYNTGSDGFVYQDDRKFTVRELQQLAGVSEERAKRILAFTQSKSNSHSAWLTFMYPRLYIAKQLLKDEGVIFISIDDNEVAQLRLLMDEIFGEENFVAEIIWERAYAPVNLKKHFSESHDYILVFAKNLSQIDQITLSRTIDADNRYKNLDNDDRGLWKSGDFSVGPAVQENVYEITIPSGRKVLPPNGRSWRVSKAKFEEMLKNNEVWFGSGGDGVPSQKRFLKDVKQGMTPMTLWKYTEVDHSQEATKQLKDLFGDIHIFDYPKPTKLIKRCLDLTTTYNDLILDFFAGSGTTGDAVMQLNAEDGGNRKFILVQIPELIDEKKNKVAYDFVKTLAPPQPSPSEREFLPTIFEITKERLIRASKKINAGLEERNKNLALKIEKLASEIQTDETKAEIEELTSQITQNSKLKTQNSFKVFETMPIWDDYGFEADELDSEMTLFDESKLTEEDIKALLTTWKTFDGIPLTQELETVDLGAYIAYYGYGKLYLMDKGFTTDNLVTILQKIDEDKTFEPKSIIAFGYHFDSKNLRELSESLKNYKNRKGSEDNLVFITRY